jgi:hypothetical protein
MCSGRNMSLSPYTSMTGIFSFGTSEDQSYFERMKSPSASSRRGNSSTFGATAAYDWYIGVPFIIGAAFPLNCPWSAFISG